MTARQTWVTKVAGGARRAVQEYGLTVTQGPDRGKTVKVRASRFRLGALEGNDLLLSDPSVSGLHCELMSDERGVRVHDLGSRNGTVINGVLVADAFLTGPATLELGGTQVAFTPGAGSVELEASAAETFGPLVGRSVAMRELFSRLESFASRGSTVLIH